MGRITLEGVRKSFGNYAVIHDANLDIEDGSFVVFVGPSGCGKTTLLRLIAGLEDITAGRILIDGTNVVGVPPAKRGLSMVFQSYALYPHMSVRGNIGFGLKMAGLPRDEINRRVEAAAATLNLTQYLDRRPRELSGGQRQRVAIGRAIVRVANLLPVDASGIWGGTFHSIGNRMLRRHGSALGYSSGFTIMDREDQKDLINTVVASAGIDPKEIRFPKGDVLAEIFSFVVNTETPMEELLAGKFPYFLPLLDRIKDVHARYERGRKRPTRSISTICSKRHCRCSNNMKTIAAFYRRQFQFILVDEYQDTNKIQADFIDTLAVEHHNVMVVGDDAQSIYSWRGANFKNILEFPKRYPEAQVFKIEMNYRSVPEILQVANAAISANVQQFRKKPQRRRANRMR